MKVISVLLICLVLCLVGSCVFLPAEIVYVSLFGCFLFLSRKLPLVHWRWDGLLMMLCCLMALIFVSHFLLRWFCNATANDSKSVTKHWTFKATTASVLLVLTAFGGGIAVVGCIHHVSWLVNSESEIYAQQLKGDSENLLKYRVRELHLALLNNHELGPIIGAKQDVRQSWVTFLLTELSYRCEQLDLDQPWDEPNNTVYFQNILPKICNPSLRTPPYYDERGFALSHFAANVHLQHPTGAIDTEKALNADANLLVIGEVNSQFEAWGKPGNFRDPRNGIFTPNGYGGAGLGKQAVFSMSDGSVRTISASIDPDVLERLSVPQQRN